MLGSLLRRSGNCEKCRDLGNMWGERRGSCAVSLGRKEGKERRESVSQSYSERRERETYLHSGEGKASFCKILITYSTDRIPDGLRSVKNL